jgi:hypothetical protein
MYTLPLSTSRVVSRSYEFLLRRAFPEGTEEGRFLDRFLEQSGRVQSLETPFPRTLAELIPFLNTLVSEPMSPLALRERILERHAGRVPHLTGETIDHFELAAHLIFRIEKAGIQVLADEASRRGLLELAGRFGGFNSPLFIGHGAERALRILLSREMGEMVAPSKGSVWVVTYRSHHFRQIEHSMNREGFLAYLQTHFTDREIKEIQQAGTGQEPFYSRMAALLAAKHAVLKLLKMAGHEREIEIQNGVPILHGEVKKALGIWHLMAAATDEGDLGIGAAILQSPRILPGGFFHLKLRSCRSMWESEVQNLFSQHSRTITVGEAVVELAIVA